MLQQSPPLPLHQDLGYGQEKRAGGQPARLGSPWVRWRAWRVDLNRHIILMPVPEYEPEKPPRVKPISCLVTSTFLTTRKGSGEFRSQPRTGRGCCASAALPSVLQDGHGLAFGERGVLLFLPSAAHAETSQGFNQTFLAHYKKKRHFYNKSNGP